jgi:hypothetical protein
MRGIKGTAMPREKRLEQRRKASRKYYSKPENKEKQRILQNKWYQKNKEYAKEEARKWVSMHPCEAKENHAKYAKENKEKIRLVVARGRRKVKINAMSHYSKGQPVCACCGETELTFLTIDHINNDGNKHRKEEPKARQLYPWLIKNNFPEGFQVLCWNCNVGKKYYGRCPHKLTPEERND